MDNGKLSDPSISDLRQRLNAKVKEIIEGYEVEKLPKKLVQEIMNIMERHKHG